MHCATTDDLVGHLQTNTDVFKLHISELIERSDFNKFIEKCNDKEIEYLVEICSKQNIFLIHKVIETITNKESLSFLERNLTYYKQDKIYLDSEHRTWLHTAVIFNRSIEILNYLINTINIKIDAKDVYRYTPLHFACQKERCSIDEMTLLIKDSDQLIKQSTSGSTALEFLCRNEANLACIFEIEKINVEKILKEIDKVARGTIDVEPVYCNINLPVDKIWLNILQRDSKYFLIRHIQKDTEFQDKYYLNENDIIHIIRNCTENGQGILTYIRKNYIHENKTIHVSLRKILQTLTGIRIKESQGKNAFYKSSTFLALITGRLDLIPTLLEYTQFEIVPYAMLICLICHRLSMGSMFSLQIINDILKVKNFCEMYAIEVINRTSNKDRSSHKTVISNYVTHKSLHLDNKSLVDIAYRAKCKIFLSLPTCQQALDTMWQRGKFKSPIFKFYFHLLMYSLFVIIFSYTLLSCLNVNIIHLEMLCYIYGAGYAVEEARHMYDCWKTDYMSSYFKDSCNNIDLMALFFMFFGFLMRLYISIKKVSLLGNMTQFEESREVDMFAMRLILCLSLILFYVRMLYFASIFEIFGPKLKMIGKMIVRDLLPLLLIFSVFVVAFGVAFQALLYPNRFYTKNPISDNNYVKKPLAFIIGDMFRRATFSIFDTHYTLEEMENKQNSYQTDATGQYAVYVLLLVFIFVVNVMLMNLLIALFSYTVTVIIMKSKESWKSSRYKTIMQYKDISIVPPPFNILSWSVEIIKFVLRKRVTRKKTRQHSSVLIKLDEISANEVKVNLSISYYILQALAINNNRYNLVQSDQDKEYERDNRILEIEKMLKEINCKLSKMGSPSSMHSMN